MGYYLLLWGLLWDKKVMLNLLYNTNSLVKSDAFPLEEPLNRSVLGNVVTSIHTGL